MHILASPFATLDTRTIQGTLPDKIADIVEENDIGSIVVGYPLHLDGRISEKAHAVDAFINMLHTRLPEIPIIKADERYSSVEAEKMIRATAKKNRFDKSAIDRYAAAVVLQDFLNEQAGGAPNG